MIIRKIQPHEYHFLEQMLYEAIYIPPSQPPLPLDVIYQPELEKYFKHFGLDNDFCLVAEDNDILIGAIWIRLFNKHNPGYAYINNSTPELSIAISPSYRGIGIGTLLFNKFFEELSSKDYTHISLSVNIDNPAIRLYKRIGFSTHLIHNDSCIMIKKI